MLVRLIVPFRRIRRIKPVRPIKQIRTVRMVRTDRLADDERRATQGKQYDPLTCVDYRSAYQRIA